jgi:hypothetical protein
MNDFHAGFAAWLRFPTAAPAERWSGAVRRLIAVHPVLVAALDPILVARDRLSEEFARLDKLVGIRRATMPSATA